MKKVTFVVTALVCATILAASNASAGIFSRGAAAPSGQVVWTQQSPTPPNPTVRTPVAGYSPNFAAPQPATMEHLARDANRLVRWQGWLDIDAFSVSVLNKMQRQLGSGIQVGSFTLEEPSINAAVLNAKASNSTFVLCPILEGGSGINFERLPTLYVWTYRHNFADTGLYQLYVSAKGTMVIGQETVWVPWHTPGTPPELHRDIQSLYYEFGTAYGGGPGESGERPVRRPVVVDIEVWRGAVVYVNARGELEVAGNEGGVEVWERHRPVEAAPLALWERAPSLICNPNYNPRNATGPAFVEPLERAISISGNQVQQRAGNVQSRIRVVNPWRFR